MRGLGLLSICPPKKKKQQACPCWSQGTLTFSMDVTLCIIQITSRTISDFQVRGLSPPRQFTANEGKFIIGSGTTTRTVSIVLGSIKKTTTAFARVTLQRRGMTFRCDQHAYAKANQLVCDKNYVRYSSSFVASFIVC